MLRFYVQSVVRLALASQQFARFSDDLLKNREAKRLPQSGSITLVQPPSASARKDNDRMRQ